MKKRTFKTSLKLALVAIFMMSVGAVSAQQTDGATGIAKIEDAGKSKVLNGTIRVIDNKGTKKFLQVQNGLTLLTNEAPDGGIVSTWQLGGTLTDDTEIKADGKEFKITLENGGTFIVDGIEETEEVAATTIGTSGYTVLVRNEATGEVEKMLVSDLVEGGHMEVEATADTTVPAISDATIPAEYQKVSVYRNGAKLRANVDYTVAAGAVTLVPQAGAPNDWAIYNGDIFEVQWVK
ncbi:hypothetical protein SAMN05444411_106119 [Lutibacter oricola]|uniref:Uncharacterized protein n=1 Tax=Lutibacter oricola TaxID=762486 RepID=A0A1H3CCJ8_9FLAO|nr:hypothetical protein [Lutibacter oricola]SDX51628.1 hypothetical protein SAMN05444411_106119 [Lutibacter oricola]